MSYIVVFVIAFAIAWIITPLSATLGQRLRLIDTPGGRRTHQGEVPRSGGWPCSPGLWRPAC